MESAQETQRSPAELIAEMNRTGGVEPTPAPAAPAPSIPEPAPAAATPEPAKPASATPAPPPETKKEEEYKVQDPAFVKRVEEPVKETQTAEPAPGEPAKPATTPEPDPTVENDEIVFNRLSEMTNGALKSEEDLLGHFNDYNALLEEKEKGFEPVFKDERAKMAYQLLANSPGTELETAERTIRALRLDIGKLEPKEALFNAYLLDPKNSDLTPLQAREYFEAEYDEKYPDLENPLIKRKHEVDAREAKQAINKIQTDFKAPETQAQEVSQDVIDSIGQTVENFGGIKMAFTDNPQESDYLTIPIKDEGELHQLHENALHPNEWLNKHMNQFLGDNGRFDYQGYIQDFYEMVNHKAIRQQAHDHGLKLGKLQKINEDRNQQTPQEIANLGKSAPAPVEKPKSFMEAWESAERQRG